MSSTGEKSKAPEICQSSQEFFAKSLDQAFEYFRLEPPASSRAYLVNLLEKYMLSQNLFDIDEVTGRYKRDTLAEMFLKAQNESSNILRVELLKKLGDTSLYISGFFGDSLRRKLVDIDYYADMGGAAYGSLAKETTDSSLSEVYACFSSRFINFVDVLTYMSQKSQVQSDKDLLRLYDRYMATGSKLAEDQLLEQGVLNSELIKTRSTKQ